MLAFGGLGVQRGLGKGLGGFRGLGLSGFGG